MQRSFGKFPHQLVDRMRLASALRKQAMDEIGGMIRRAAARGTPKEIAGAVGLSDEGVRKIRDSDRVNPGLATVIAFMEADPEVAAVIENYARRCRQPDFWDYDIAEKNHRGGR